MSSNDDPGDEAERIHFVTVDSLQDELDRLDISRTDACVVCDTSVPDEGIGELRQAEPEYETVCVRCKAKTGGVDR